MKRPAEDDASASSLPRTARPSLVIGTFEPTFDPLAPMVATTMLRVVAIAWPAELNQAAQKPPPGRAVMVSKVSSKICCSTPSDTRNGGLGAICALNVCTYTYASTPLGAGSGPPS